MPRFVILTHDHPKLHWDLMLEDDTVLRTWRLLTSPDSLDVEIIVEPLPDHRLFYLDYEGPVSNNRGHVKQFDAGDYQLISENEHELILQLNGNCINGKYALRQKKETDGNKTGWVFTRMQ